MPRNQTAKPAIFKVAFAILFAAMPFLPAEAGASPLPLEREGYSLTFPDGWDTLPVSGTEASFQVFNPDLGENVAAFGNGVPYNAALPPSFWIDTYAGALIEGYERTDSSSKTLGGRAFTTSEYKDTAEDGDSDMRIRIYVATEGSFLFLTWLTYSVEDAAKTTESFETGLSTLEIDASARLVRRARSLGEADGRGPRLDALGRNRKPAGNRAPRLPLFTRP